MKKIIIQTELNTKGFSKRRELDKVWLANRLQIMSEFTARSLSQQTKTDFEWHILTRKETKYFVVNNFTANLNNDIIVTPDESESIIIDHCKCYDQIYLIRLNSDDCYRENFIDIVFNFKPKPGIECLVFQNGFMWYQKENKIIERDFPSPPFYALIYDSKEYLRGKRYEFKGHNFLRMSLKSQALKERLWLWLVHDFNNKILRGSNYPDYRLFKVVDNSIIKSFGIKYDS